MKKFLFCVLLALPFAALSQQAPLPADSLVDKTIVIKPKTEEQLLAATKEQQSINERKASIDAQVKSLITIILENGDVEEKDVYDLKYEPGKFVLKLRKKKPKK